MCNARNARIATVLCFSLPASASTPGEAQAWQGRWRALRFNKPEPGLLHHFVVRACVCTCNVCLDAVPQRRTRKVPASGGERWAVYSGEAGNVEAVSIGRAHENVLVGAA